MVLINYGTQVLIVRQKLLSVIQQRCSWTVEQYQLWNLELDQQPVGASGEALGVVAVVVLRITIEGTDATFDVPMYYSQVSHCGKVT